jgi:MraZ protein
MGDDKCISVMTKADAEAMLDEVRVEVKEGRQPKDALRVLALNMVAVTVDGQGRITIDEKLRSYAGLTPGSKVMVAGAIDRVEIWEPTRFAAMSARGEAAIAGGA